MAAAPAARADTLAFGSCLQQWFPQPVWSSVLAQDPEAFVFLGDNVYTDNGPYARLPEPERIGVAYAALAENARYRAVRDAVPIFATWDDHDYGVNDGGAEYPHKDAAKRHFMDFFAIPDDDPMRGREGIYAVRYLGEGPDRIQLLLLDTRSFRTPLLAGETNAQCPNKRYLPNEDPTASVLGEAQWRWLEQQLREPAGLRVIASSIQVIPDRHCFEKWGNFPRERERLFRLIRDTAANGVVLVSGDRHLAEISRLPAEHAGYPLIELTTSGMNSAIGLDEPNPYRTTPDNFRGDNFGLLRIDRSGAEATVVIEVRDAAGELALRETVALDALRQDG